MSTVTESKQSYVTNPPQAKRAKESGIVLSRLDALSDKLLFAALLVVLLACPFEVGYPPLGRILFSTFTDLELALFVLAGAVLLRLAVSDAARKRLLKLPLILPILALVAASIASTTLGEYRVLGVQSTYRLLMGAMVFAAVYEALRSVRRVFQAMVAFVAGALLSAGVGLLEFVSWVDIEPWLQVFKPQPTTVGGMLRLSGSFEYANGAAVYFEMALPLLLSMVLLFSSERFTAALFSSGITPAVRRIVRTGLFVAAAMLTMALILTFSRASWIGVFVSMGVFGVALFLIARNAQHRWAWRILRVPFFALLAVIVLAAAYTYASQPLLRLRLTGENDSAWYRYTLTPAGGINRISANNVVTMPVTLSNPGPMPWNAARVPTVNLSYHWRVDGEQYYAIFDGLRTPLPHDVAAGESVTVDAYVQAPTTPGEYTLEWDLVQENVSWFREKNKMPAVSSTIEVGAATEKAAQPQIVHPPVRVQSVDEADTSTVPRMQLWRTAFSMFRAHPLTGVGPDGFRNLYGKYAGTRNWNTNIYTNNTYIEMFTNLGLAGGLSFLLLLGLWLRRATAGLVYPFTHKSGNWTPGAWLLFVGPCAALIAFAVHGLTDYFLFSTPLYTAFWFILGLGVLWTGISPTEQVEAPAYLFSSPQPAKGLDLC